MTCTFIYLLLNSFDLRSYSSKLRKICTFRLLCCWSTEGRGFFCFPVRDWEGVCRKLLSLVFLNFQLLAKNAEFHIHQSHMEIGLSEVIKFCTRNLIKMTHFMSPLKMINLFQDMIPNFCPKAVGLQVSRPAILMIIRHSWSPKITNFWGSK